jgi:1-acyl-sn-glycerol-3-phosphate acyltransferase
MRKFIPWLFHLIFFRLGPWKCDMRLPDGLRKAVILAVPHTANRDFPVGVGASYTMTGRYGFLGKKELFDGPFGWVFRAVGGIPVDRSSSHNMVDQVATFMNAQDEFFLVMAPEGTRKRTERWKTGFYQIAKKLKVPIVLGYMDFKEKKVGLERVLYPTWDEDRDFAEIEAFYGTITACYPEKYNPKLR